MNQIILQMQNLNKSFNGVVAIKDISYSFIKNEIVLLTGENGTGKTTLFNLITGLEKPTDGKIFYEGIEITKKSPLYISRQGIIRLYQYPRLFKNLLVWENLLTAIHRPIFSGILNFVKKKEKIDYVSEKIKATKLLHQFGLQDTIHKTAGELSFGQQKIVSFCMLALAPLKLALLDEPFSGLSQLLINKLTDVILRMKMEGITFIIIEHNLQEASKFCDTHIIINQGNIYNNNSN